MNRLLIASIVLLTSFVVATSSATAAHVIDQATFPPGCGCRPAVAVDLDHWTAIAFITESEAMPEPHVGVQLVPTNPDTDEAWPAPVYFGPGDRPAICFSRDGFTLAFISGDAVVTYQGDSEGNWDPEPTVLHPGGTVRGLDLWGAPTDAAGHAVFLVVDDDIDPDSVGGCRVHVASRSGVTGWTDLELLVDDLDRTHGAQISWTHGPAGPWPEVYYLDDGMDEHELYRVHRGEDGWTAPVRVPGDGGQGPTSFEWEFDVVRYQQIGIVGLGPQPTCPCGTIHGLVDDGNGWLPEDHLTVDHDEFDWPFSPRIAAGWDGPLHAFWYQRTAGQFMEYLGDALEYWTWDDGTWTDAGAFLDHLDSGIGQRVDVGVVPDGSASVLVWSQVDTIDGEPQLEQVFMARQSGVSGAQAALPAVPATLTAWPNPFNPRVNLAVTLPWDGSVQLDVHDARGRLVRSLHHGALAAGRHTFVWDGRLDTGRQAPSGVYLARAVTGEGIVTRKLVLAE